MNQNKLATNSRQLMWDETGAIITLCLLGDWLLNQYKHSDTGREASRLVSQAEGINPQLKIEPVLPIL